MANREIKSGGSWARSTEASGFLRSMCLLVLKIPVRVLGRGFGRCVQKWSGARGFLSFEIERVQGSNRKLLYSLSLGFARGQDISI